jgi:serine/threonine-protein kinase
VGDLVGNYRVQHRLAEGGMGTVYVATHIVLPRRVAIKILRPELLDLDGAKQGILNEASILESMNDPRVARLFDAGVLADGRPWLAMELVEGECLAEVLARRGKLAVPEVAPIVNAIVDALAAAHLAGYVHGDVKPENVILCASPTGCMEVKLIDWGIAKSPNGSPHDGKMAVGTPHYMAPEQVRGEPLDARADVYALGVLCYELLVGAPPFVGDRPTDLAAQHLSKKPRPVRELNADVPPAIDALVQKMLAKDRADRPMLETVRACFSLVTESQLAKDEEQEFDDFEITVEVPRAIAQFVAGADVTRKESPRARWTPQPNHHAIADHVTLRLGRVVNSSGKPNAVASGTLPMRRTQAGRH